MQTTVKSWCEAGRHGSTLVNQPFFKEDLATKSEESEENKFPSGRI